MPSSIVRAASSRQWLYLPQFIEVTHEPYAFMKYVATHPKINWVDSKLRFDLPESQQRGSTAKWAKNHITYMRDIFTESTISLVIFAGMNSKSESFKIHKDTMDVFFVQAHGNITWQIWDNAEGDGDPLLDTIMTPGDAVYVPRGVYHRVIQSEPRVGYSFGVEGPDPTLYL